jgi:antirestriction protein ArdC
MKHKFNSAADREDIYSRVTARIIADLERGVIPWSKSWDAAATMQRPLRHNGQPYAGINILMLWVSAQDRGYTSPTWMTFRQALECGGNVRKGEKGTPVVYANAITREEQESDGSTTTREIPYLKTYTAFNVDQIEGLPEHFYSKPASWAREVERINEAESFFAATGADIRTGGARAFYNPAEDYIRMPPIESFRDAQSYYATLAHETTHWTSHGSRLDRSFGREKWGDEGYAREELVAELGAAYLCADLGLTPAVREDHASYIASWLSVLKDDKRAIFSAASQAQRALDYIHALQPQEPELEAAPEAEYGATPDADGEQGATPEAHDEPAPAVAAPQLKFF